MNKIEQAIEKLSNESIKIKAAELINRLKISGKKNRERQEKLTKRTNE